MEAEGENKLRTHRFVQEGSRPCSLRERNSRFEGYRDVKMRCTLQKEQSLSGHLHDANILEGKNISVLSS